MYGHIRNLPHPRCMHVLGVGGAALNIAHEYHIHLHIVPESTIGCSISCVLQNIEIAVRSAAKGKGTKRIFPRSTCTR